MQLCCRLSILWHCLSLGWECKLTFSSSVATVVFQICWHTAWSTFTASSFRIWKSLTGIQSPPLALFIVILPKANLTSHSRMSGSRWVITPSWLSGLWRSFLYSSSVYPCHLFLISSASVRSIPFLSFIEPIFAWNTPLVSGSNSYDWTWKNRLVPNRKRSTSRQYIYCNATYLTYMQSASWKVLGWMKHKL